MTRAEWVDALCECCRVPDDDPLPLRVVLRLLEAEQRPKLVAYVDTIARAPITDAVREEVFSGFKQSLTKCVRAIRQSYLREQRRGILEPDAFQRFQAAVERAALEFEFEATNVHRKGAGYESSH